MQKQIRIFLISLTALSANTWADADYHKNSLIGGRAATMGGAYKAISDDASGAYHNPAGLVFANNNSISGSANTFVISKTEYKETIGARNWERDTTNLLPNFFGLVKKFKDYTFGLSYMVTDSQIEHQDQVFKNLRELSTPVDTYSLNLHTEDNTYLLGPSFAMKLNSELNFGASLFYHYRVFRRSYSQLIKFSDADDFSSYENLTKKEKGAKLKAGLMWSRGKNSVGLTLAKTMIITALTDSQANTKDKGSAVVNFGRSSITDKPKMPIELGAGWAHFFSPYFLISADFDYYLHSDDNKDDVWNASVGSEYFLNETYALRGGAYTNNTNSKEPADVAANTPVEHMDMYGLTSGLAIHSKGSVVTLGVGYGFGKGDAKIYNSQNNISNVTRDFNREVLNFVIAADYEF
jgi:hypothetical protein